MAVTKRQSKRAAKRREGPAVVTLPILDSRAQAITCGYPDSFLTEARRAGCAAFHSGGKIDPVLLNKYIFTRSESDVETLDHKDRWTKAKADREELKLQLEQGEVVQKPMVKDVVLQVNAATLESLRKDLKEYIPSACQNLPRDRIEAILEDRWATIVEDARAKLDGGIEKVTQKLIRDDDEDDDLPTVKAPRKRARRTEIVRTGRKAGRPKSKD